MAKQISAKLEPDGSWKVEINAPELPLTGRELKRLMRTILVAHKGHFKQYHLNQRALQRKAEQAKPTSTGQKELTNV